MQYRTLGRTGLQVSEVGFGGAGIGQVWGETTDAESIAAIQRALALGINFFDTSPMYGGGRSEENLGRGLAGHRGEVYIATKVRLQSEAERANPLAAVRRSERKACAASTPTTLTCSRSITKSDWNGGSTWPPSARRRAMPCC